MKVLITGGAGFIGRHLTTKLQHVGHWVRWLDNLDPQVHGDALANLASYNQPADELIVGDVRNREDWFRSIDGIDAVVHLAAQTGTGQSMYQVSYYTEVNVGGTAHLWDCLANSRTNVKKVLIASSRSIYGEGSYRCPQCGIVVPEPRTHDELQLHNWDLNCPTCHKIIEAIATSETSSPNPASLYACSKLAQEQMSLTMGKALGISTTALRFQNVFGPGQSLRNPYTGIISIFSNQMRQNLPINIYEDGNESRDFVYVDDVANICVNVLSSESPTEVINVGSGQPTKVIDLANLLKHLWNSQSEIKITGDFRVGDIRHNWADLSRLRGKYLNWQPTPLDVGLKHFVDWAAEQPVYPDLSNKASIELKNRNL